MNIERLINSYKKKLEFILSEVKELDLKNEDDNRLCKNLQIKIDCYKSFIKELESISTEKAS